MYSVHVVQSTLLMQFTKILVIIDNQWLATGSAVLKEKKSCNSVCFMVYEETLNELNIYNCFILYWPFPTSISTESGGYRASVLLSSGTLYSAQMNFVVKTQIRHEILLGLDYTES